MNRVFGPRAARIATPVRRMMSGVLLHSAHGHSPGPSHLYQISTFTISKGVAYSKRDRRAVAETGWSDLGASVDQGDWSRVR